MASPLLRDPAVSCPCRDIVSNTMHEKEEEKTASAVWRNDAYRCNDITMRSCTYRVPVRSRKSDYVDDFHAGWRERVDGSQRVKRSEAGSRNTRRRRVRQTARWNIKFHRVQVSADHAHTCTCNATLMRHVLFNSGRPACPAAACRVSYAQLRTRLFIANPAAIPRNALTGAAVVGG
jgi:hypothetical protein